MNCTVYLFGDFGQGYIQYPLNENVFAVSDNSINGHTQMVITRDNNLISYKYIHRERSYYIGLCIEFNEVIVHDIHNLYKTLELLFEEYLLRSSILFENYIPRISEFQHSSEELKNIIDLFEQKLSNSDFKYKTFEPIGSSTILQDSIILSLDMANDEEIISSQSKYKELILIKGNETSILSAVNRIQKESVEWEVKRKNYDSSLENSLLILAKIVIAIILFGVPYLMFLSPKKRVEEQILKTQYQIQQINKTREELSNRLLTVTDSVSLIRTEVNAITIQLKLLESAQEITKNRRTFNIGSIEFTMLKVNEGRFLMGSNSGEDDESPTHRVTLRGFYIGETEVTQELWKEVMNSNPSSRTGDERPVTNVSWNECMAFIRKLNEKTGLPFALPTEAQWEFAARGGSKSKGYKYSGSNYCFDVANCVDYSFWGELLGYSNSTNYVASYSPNELGIYDMSGNVWEWCYDSYRYYDGSEQKNPVNSNGEQKVIRGGGYKNTPSYCRSTYRGHKYYNESADNIGFRLVLNEALGSEMVDTEKKLNTNTQKGTSSQSTPQNNKSSKGPTNVIKEVNVKDLQKYLNQVK